MSSIAAIDIGSTKAVTVIADVDSSDGIRIVAVGTAQCNGLKKGTVVDIEDTAQSVVNSVRKAEQMANRKISSVTVGITGEHIESVASKGLVPILNPSRTISREDVHRVINHSKQIALETDRELILAVPRSFKVDGNDGVTRPIGMSGERLEVDTLLITGLASHLENLERCVNRAQIEIEQIVPQQVATGMAVADKQEQELGVAVIDIGGGNTDVAVYFEGSIAHVGMVPLGSMHITSDISVLLKTAIQEADRLKLEGATCGYESIPENEPVDVQQVGSPGRRPFPRRILGEMVAARAKEILCFARSIIEDCAPFDKLTGGIIITGGGSRLKGLAPFAEKLFPETPVRLGAPSKIAGLGDMLASPEYSTAAGLIRYALRTRQDESVGAETGDWRKIFGKLGSIFGAKQREDGIRS